MIDKEKRIGDDTTIGAHLDLSIRRRELITWLLVVFAACASMQDGRRRPAVALCRENWVEHDQVICRMYQQVEFIVYSCVKQSGFDGASFISNVEEDGGGSLQGLHSLHELCACIEGSEVESL